MTSRNKTIWESAPTSEEQVADQLRRHILAGELPVGEFLSQRKLAELAGTSVISVRGALRQLENEGLVENVPRMGVRIPLDTPSSVRDRYLVRSALEATAVQQICGKLDENEKAALLEMAAELDRMAGEHTTETWRDFARIHQQFHLLIAESTGNPLLVQMLKRVINPSLMMLNAARSWEIPSALEENHTDLARAILSGNPDAAVRDLREHIQVGLESELAAL
jgi:DNA-binding GntR family transcriptional regulator